MIEPRDDERRDLIEPRDDERRDLIEPREDERRDLIEPRDDERRDLIEPRDDERRDDVLLGASTDTVVVREGELIDIVRELDDIIYIIINYHLISQQFLLHVQSMVVFHLIIIFYLKYP